VRPANLGRIAGRAAAARIAKPSISAALTGWEKK